MSKSIFIADMVALPQHATTMGLRDDFNKVNVIGVAVDRSHFARLLRQRLGFGSRVATMFAQSARIDPTFRTWAMLAEQHIVSEHQDDVYLASPFAPGVYRAYSCSLVRVATLHATNDSYLAPTVG